MPAKGQGRVSAPTPAPPHHGSLTMNKPISAKDVAAAEGQHRAACGSRKIYSAPQGHDDVMVPFREIALTDGTSFRVHDTSGPYTDAEAGIDVNRGLKPLRAGWIAARGGGPVTQLELARAGIVTKEMVYVAHRENIGRQGQADEAEARLADGESFGASHPSLRDAGVRAQRSRPRPRHHPRQHQSPRIRADDHRPELRDQDQRQYRQLRRHLLGRGGGGEDGVGDPLGRRHRHGPLDRAQHPPDARMDHPQCAGADRHGADLSGAGEGARRSGQARLGGLSRHADRAGRAGRRLFHHPCRRASRLHPSHRAPRHRHRVARRLDHGQMVPGASPRELPLRALRGDLRHHAPLRRVVLASATGFGRDRSPTPTTAPNSPSSRRLAS